MERRGLPHSSHWGAFSVLLRDKGIEIVPHSQDANPSLLLGKMDHIIHIVVGVGFLAGGALGKSE